MEALPHIISGHRVAGTTGAAFDKVNPATGEVVGRITDGGVQDANLAVASSREAQAEWSKLDPSDRGQLVWGFADRVEAAREELAEMDSLDAGKPLLDCMEDVNAAVKLLRSYAGLPDKIRGNTARPARICRFHES